MNARERADAGLCSTYRWRRFDGGPVGDWGRGTYDEGMNGEHDAPKEGDEPYEGPHIVIGPEQMAGVWANFAVVSHTIHEFTLDFVRLDGTSSPPGSGIVVSRVSVSPLFVTQLIDALTDNWQTYAAKAMPEEVQRDDDTSD